MPKKNFTALKIEEKNFTAQKIEEKNFTAQEFEEKNFTARKNIHGPPLDIKWSMPNLPSSLRYTKH